MCGYVATLLPVFFQKWLNATSRSITPPSVHWLGAEHGEVGEVEPMSAYTHPYISTYPPLPLQGVGRQGGGEVEREWVKYTP